MERDGAGNATAVVAPGGQRTALVVDGAGALRSVKNLALEETTFEYGADGLMTRLVDPKPQAHVFGYDDRGRLERDDDPAGGFKALVRTDSPSSYAVDVTSRLGRAWKYVVERLAAGGTRRVNTDPASLQTVLNVGPDGSRQSIYPDGSQITVAKSPDPRFGMAAPVSGTTDITTPGGRHVVLTQAREVALADPTDLSSVVSAITAISGW